MWYNKEEGKFLTLEQIKKKIYPATIPFNPSPDAFEHIEIYWVEYDEKPKTTENQYLTPGNVAVKDGVFVRTWEKKKYTREHVEREKLHTQDRLKEECKRGILKIYPEHKQISATMGIYGKEYNKEMKTFISKCIKEENRLSSLIEECKTMKDLKNVGEPKWPF